jgi:hypothetical protein
MYREALNSHSSADQKLWQNKREIYKTLTNYEKEQLFT